MFSMIHFSRPVKRKRSTHLFDKDFLTARLSHKVKYPQLTQSLFEIRLKSKHT